MITLDTRYYTSGCLGCGQTEESCYSGFLIQDKENWGIVYGSTESKEEHIIGCADSCGGCFASDGTGRYIVDIVETAAGIG